jgi:uncharacterized membrane protein
MTGRLCMGLVYGVWLIATLVALIAVAAITSAAIGL